MIDVSEGVVEEWVGIDRTTAITTTTKTTTTTKFTPFIT
jgi:hypothetical protein